MKACQACGREFDPRDPRVRSCSKECGGALRRAPRSHPSGYVRIFSPGHELAAKDGYILEHRLVLFNAGVPVPDGFHIHHRNGIKTDNRIENLEVLSASDHHRRHMATGAQVQNQFGTFTVGTDEERAAIKKERMAIWRAENRDKIRAYKRARKAAGLPY